MDDLPDLDKLKALVSLLAPGLIILTIRSSVQGGPRPELKDRLFHYAAISAVYYAVAFPLFNWKNGVILTEEIWYLCQYFLLPLATGVFFAFEAQGEWLYRIAARCGLSLAHPIPAAWDFAFSKIESGTFVLVTMNGDQQVAGLVGRRSFASSSREERDLLLEEVWEVGQTGAWSAAVPPRSILLCGRDIRHVEIFWERMTMPDDQGREPQPLDEGYQPQERGYEPRKVQGGYQPGTSQHGKPPTGGSAVQPKKD